VSAVKTLSGKTLLLAAIFTTLLSAHVGSPDVFHQGKAGPYPVLVSIRPPDVIPGIAHIEVRALAPGIQRVELTPTPMTGEASKHPPVADAAHRSAADPQSFEGQLWLMGFGSWEVHVRVYGAQGAGELLVPVPAIATKASSMQKETGYFLFGMMVFLSVGMVAIVGAAVRESRLTPGDASPRWTARPLVWMLFTAVLVAAALWFGRAWWADDAATYARRLYKPLKAAARLAADGKSLELQLTDPGWMAMRKLDDLVPDHGHLLHLFLIRYPAMDQVFHLHPDQTATGYFGTPLPSMPAGQYKVFADIVHENGLAETAVGDVTLPELHGTALSGDDAGGASVPSGDTFLLPDGYRMVWKHEASKPVKATQVNLFTFALEAPDGQPAKDVEPYMGMGGHAEFVKTDGTVFAHLHPTGSVPMASMNVASPQAMMAMHQMQVGPEVSFPYGIPKPGDYRIFVQMRRAGRVETGAFALQVMKP
jgi:hypothetical protein